MLRRLRERGRQRIKGAAGQKPEAVVSCDEMWTYRGARLGDKWEDCWIWTAVIQEQDGSRWVDFEVGTAARVHFCGCYERLPEAGMYRRDAYPVYRWFPPERHVASKGGSVNWNGTRGCTRCGGAS